MENVLKNKHIVLGITGSIAAYKAAYLVRALVKKGAEVQVIMTPAGKEFIAPLTLSTLSSKPVISEFFSNRDGSWNSHVDLGLWADAMLIAPATAATIAPGLFFPKCNFVFMNTDTVVSTFAVMPLNVPL